MDLPTTATTIYQPPPPRSTNHRHHDLPTTATTTHPPPPPRPTHQPPPQVFFVILSPPTHQPPPRSTNHPPTTTTIKLKVASSSNLSEHAGHESEEQVSLLRRMRFKIATKIMLHKFNVEGPTIRAIDDASHDKATVFKVKALEVVDKTIRQLARLLGSGSEEEADEGKDGEVEEEGKEEADEGKDGEGKEEADKGDGSGSEEEYDKGNDGYMTQMQGGKKLFARYLKEHKHLKHEAKLRSHISKLKWQTAKNHVDYRVFVMLHMKSYIGDPIAKWDVGLCEESEEHVSLLRRMRFKISTKILLHKFNVHAENIIIYDLPSSRMEEVAGRGGRRKKVAGRGGRRKKVTGKGGRHEEGVWSVELDLFRNGGRRKGGGGGRKGGGDSTKSGGCGSGESEGGSSSIKALGGDGYSRKYKEVKANARSVQSLHNCWLKL
ncbi:hypothetical protein Tco_1417591 [Tanacetum coccineum]